MRFNQRTFRPADHPTDCGYRLGRSVRTRSARGRFERKIEGFFQICQQRELNGKQGVIIPLSNVRHLSLHPDVVEAVKAETFHIWAVSSVEEALPLLTGADWDKEEGPCLLRSIQERIAQINQHDGRQRPWPLRWLNWFNQS